MRDAWLLGSLCCIHCCSKSCCQGDEFPLPPAPAEQTSTSWVGLRNLSPKPTNFSPGACYSFPHGKGIKLAAERQRRLSRTKECFSSPGSRHMHLPSSSHTLRWRTDAHTPLCLLPCSSFQGKKAREHKTRDPQSFPAGPQPQTPFAPQPGHSHEGYQSPQAGSHKNPFTQIQIHFSITSSRLKSSEVLFPS